MRKLTLCQLDMYILKKIRQIVMAHYSTAAKSSVLAITYVTLPYICFVFILLPFPFLIIQKCLVRNRYKFDKRYSIQKESIEFEKKSGIDENIQPNWVEFKNLPEKQSFENVRLNPNGGLDILMIASSKKDFIPWNLQWCQQKKMIQYNIS